MKAFERKILIAVWGSVILAAFYAIGWMLVR